MSDKQCKYPGTIRIGFQDYDLKFVPEGMRDTIDGHHSAYRGELRISEELQGQYRAFVVLHEIFHGCFFSTALSEAGSFTEELIVDSFSKSMAAIIRDNPDLMKALKEDLGQ